MDQFSCIHCGEDIPTGEGWLCVEGVVYCRRNPGCIEVGDRAKTIFEKAKEAGVDRDKGIEVVAA